MRNRIDKAAHRVACYSQWQSINDTAALICMFILISMWCPTLVMIITAYPLVWNVNLHDKHLGNAHNSVLPRCLLTVFVLTLGLCMPHIACSDLFCMSPQSVGTAGCVLTCHVLLQGKYREGH